MVRVSLVKFIVMPMAFQIYQHHFYHVNGLCVVIIGNQVTFLATIRHDKCQWKLESNQAESRKGSLHSQHMPLSLRMCLGAWGGDRRGSERRHGQMARGGGLWLLGRTTEGALMS